MFVKVKIYGLFQGSEKINLTTFSYNSGSIIINTDNIIRISNTLTWRKEGISLYKYKLLYLSTGEIFMCVLKSINQVEKQLGIIETEEDKKENEESIELSENKIKKNAKLYIDNHRPMLGGVVLSYVYQAYIEGAKSRNPEIEYLNNIIKEIPQ